jgi:hypothetical protein
LEIKIESCIFEAKFLDKLAPATCAAVREFLPCEVDAPHSSMSGEAINFIAPWNLRTLPRENETIYGSPGDVALVVRNDTWISVMKNRNHMFISHGTCEYRAAHGVMPCNLFAKVTDNLDELNDIGRKIWQYGRKRISLREI